MILKTGYSFAELRARIGDFEMWFARNIGWPVDRFQVIDALAGDPFPDAASVDPVIVTGSAKSVHHKEPWSVRAGEWLADVVRAEVPVLGVCYGHQLLGDVFGGDVGTNPNGREMGVCEVEIAVEHPLFYGLPSRLPVFETHTDVVNRAPDGAQVLAGNANTPIQAMQLGSSVSVQWHPEFNADILRHYITARAEIVDAELGAGTAARLLSEVVELGNGSILLRNFLERCC